MEGMRNLKKIVTEKYGREIGRKFNKDGSTIIISGNTFISMVNHDSKIYNYINTINSILNKNDFYKKYIHLPVESYHMTVIEGVIPKFKERLWTSHLSKDCNLDEVDQYFIKQFEKIQPMKCVEMQCSGIEISESGIMLRLKPNSKKDEGILKKIRNDIAEQCGLRFPNHDDYGFHISLAYYWKELNEKEKEERKATNDSINDYLKKELNSFVMQPGKLVFFDTMFRFETSRDKLKS